MQNSLWYALTMLVCLNLGSNPSFPLLPPEICNNAIDDDGDGRIDQNDEDCQCAIIEPISLIPNPSFEEQECCPNSRGQMDCATTWIQASAPTTDYLHICGWKGWDDLPMPLPIPNGKGVVGFRDGRFAREGDDNANWKEYAGACLLAPLRAGVSYKFKFNIGFTVQPFSPPIHVTFFGTTDCKNLPFGNGDDTFGCPTNGPGWKNLGAVFAAGTNEWQEKEINVTPTEDIYAIAIGPACAPQSVTINPYYFFDNLILAEQSSFDFEIRANDQPCSANLAFELPHYDTLNYQWYKEGIALIGETGSTLENPPGEGRYQVLIESSEECRITNSFIYQKPVESMQKNQTICDGEFYLFGNQRLETAGEYWDTLKTTNNCDSIIHLILQVDNNQESAVYAKIFPFESYDIGPFKFRKEGQYTETINSSFGCDSTVHLTLDFYQVYIPNIFSPNEDGLNDFFMIDGDSDLQSIKTLRVYNRWGALAYETEDIHPNARNNNGWDGRIKGQLAPTGVYVYTAEVVMDDGVARAISGMVTLVR